MLTEEKAVGCYLKSSSLDIKPNQRRGMILLVEDLNEQRSYKLETFYLAVNIADHYLMKLALSDSSSPDLILLGTTSLLLAAKIEQPNSPCIANLINLLQVRHKIKIERKAIVDLE